MRCARGGVLVSWRGCPQLAAGTIRELNADSNVPLAADGQALHLLPILLVVPSHLRAYAVRPLSMSNDELAYSLTERDYQSGRFKKAAMECRNVKQRDQEDTPFKPWDNAWITTHELAGLCSVSART